MPRPLKEDPRDCFKTFRFTASEVTRLEARARARGQTLSNLVRSTLLRPEPGEALAEASPEGNVSGAGQRGTRPSSLAAQATQVLIDQVRRLGVNLNQIAHRMNELRIPPPRELTLVLDEIRALVRQARES